MGLIFNVLGSCFFYFIFYNTENQTRRAPRISEGVKRRVFILKNVNFC